MRHKNIYLNPPGFSRKANTAYVIDKPYCHCNYTYKKPSMKRRYMQVIQFIADHDGCSRRECTAYIWNGNDPARVGRGEMSIVYSNLLWKDFIDYDKKFRYHVTEKGLKLLKEAYLNDCIELCKKIA